MRLQRQVYEVAKEIFAEKMSHVTVDIHCGKIESMMVYVWNEQIEIIAQASLNNISNITYKQIVQLLIEMLKKNAEVRNETTKSTSQVQSGREENTEL